MPRGVKGEKTSPKSCLRQNHSYIRGGVGGDSAPNCQALVIAECGEGCVLSDYK